MCFGVSLGYVIAPGMIPYRRNEGRSYCSSTVVNRQRQQATSPFATLSRRKKKYNCGISSRLGEVCERPAARLGPCHAHVAGLLALQSGHQLLLFPHHTAVVDAATAIFDRRFFPLISQEDLNTNSRRDGGRRSARIGYEYISIITSKRKESAPNAQGARGKGGRVEEGWGGGGGPALW